MDNPYLNQAYHDGYADGRGWAREHEDPLIKRTKEWEEQYQMGYDDGKGDQIIEAEKEEYKIKYEEYYRLISQYWKGDHVR